MFYKKISIYLTFTAAMSLISIDRTTAQDVSHLKMSFSDPKISVLPEQSILKPQSKQTIARNVQRDDRRTGWYWGTVRGANFPSLTATNANGSANWTGIDSLSSLLDLSNLTGFAGYKSSNFRLEGELMYANTAMTIDRQNTTSPIISNTVPNTAGVPEKCKATTFAAILNGYYDIETGGQIKPFVGAGIGFASTSLKDSGLDWGSASGLTYQLKAGVDYALSDRQDIYLQYKYINAPAQYVSQPNKQGIRQSFNTNFSSGNIEFGTKFNF